MAKKIAVVGQKGGGTKSTISRAIATTLSKAGWDALLADLDSSQKTCFEWSGRRASLTDVKQIDVVAFQTLSAAEKASAACDVMVMDGKPLADDLSVSMAKISDMTVIPTGSSVDDLTPSLRFGEKLAAQGVERNRIVFIVSKAGTERDGLDAIQNIREWGFKVVSKPIVAKGAYSKEALDVGKCITEIAREKMRIEARESIDELMGMFGDLI